MEVPLEVSVVCVVVLWVVVVLGEVCDGEVADGLDWSVDGFCVGLFCATSQTLESNRIDVIRYTFLIRSLLNYFWPAEAAIESKSEAALKG
jgi:hypothetical protein